MQDNDHQNRSSIGFIAGIIVAVLATGTVTAWWAINTLTDSPDKTTTTKKTLDPKNPDTSEQGEIYWLDTTGDRLKLQGIPLTGQKSANNQEVLQTALETLLSGPQTANNETTTTIPSGTKLLDFKLEKEELHLNLSSEFTAGGGSSSMVGRLAQLLYTATSLDSNTKVWLDIDGEPLELLGGEGLVIEQPMTRQWFEENFEL